MRHFYKVALFSGVILAFAATATAENRPEQSAPGLDLVTEARQTYIFTLSSDTSPGDVGRIARQAASVGGGQLRHLYSGALKGFSLKVSDAGLVAIEEEIPEIAGVHRNKIFSVAEKPPGTPGKGPGSSSGEEETAGSQTIPWGIERVVGQDGLGNVDIRSCGNNGADCPTVWILDTGVEGDNPDLNVDAGQSKNCVIGGGRRGKNTWEDEHGHGTHVAGTIAAIDNSIDVVGVAAGALVVSVRVLDRRGYGYTDEVICGLQHVIDNGLEGDVANMSLGGSVDSALDNAVKTAAGAGILFSLAAGNDSDHANYHSPARANHANIYTVSAIDSSNTFAWFSNYGNPPIEFAAPGVSVLSLSRGGGTTTKSGTSMAAPHVAGLLLLTGGVVKCDGNASGDPDGNPDPIAHLKPGSCP
jgi:subtilisin family serine protease